MKQILLFLMVFLFVTGIAYSAPSNTISIPSSFSPNTVIQSSQVNANNSEVQTKFNAHNHTDITALGSVTTGTWNANAVGVAYGGTGLTTINPGEIIYSDATGSIARLSPGTNGQYLRTQGTIAAAPQWVTIGASHQASGAVGVISSPTTTSDTYVDLSDMSITLTTGANPVLVVGSGSFADSGTGGVYVIIDVDGTDQTETERWADDGSASVTKTISTNLLKTMTTGSHTFKMQWHRTAAATVTAQGVDRRMEIIELK